MPENITFGPLSDASPTNEQFKEFHNLLFKNTNVSTEWIDWWFGRMAPHTRIHAAWDDGKLIGTWCVEPKRLRWESNILSVGRCFSVGIHPDYRRRNLFVQLSEHAIKEERTLGEFEYVLGFPQMGRPVVDAHLKAGWEHVQNIDIYSFKPAMLTSFISLKDCNRRPDFREQPAYPGAFIRRHSDETLRWTENPDNHYTTLGYGKAYVVLKNYGNVCHILDIVGNVDEVRHLLRVTQTLAHRHRWEEITVWNATNERHHVDIAGCGFTLGADHASSVQLLAVKINATKPLWFHETHFQMGGEEMY